MSAYQASMKKTQKILAVLLALALVGMMAACGSLYSSTTETTTEETESTTTAAATTMDVSEMFTDRDYEVGYSDYVTITLEDGSSSADGDGVTIDEDTITITEEGTYLLTGELSDGQIIVNVDDTEKVQLVLDNASITSSESAAIYVQEADKVFLTTAKGSTNTVQSTAEFTEADEETGDNVDGAIFSTATLTMNGNGTLIVESDNGHGVVSKDDLKITSGTYEITAAKKGLSGKDSVRIADGTITITSGKTGIHSSNNEDDDKGFVYIKGGTITISAGNDGVHAERALLITGGTITVTESNEGLEGATIEITGGTMDITASDDGLNASGVSTESEDDTTDSGSDGFMNDFMAGGGMDEYDDTANLIISGGELYVDAGGDGLDSNGNLIMSGGTVYVDGPTYGGDGALDVAGTANITGGTAVLVGSVGMDTNFSDESTQCSILVQLDSEQEAGTTITLTDSDGNVVLEYTPQKQYQSIVISTADLETGETYTLTAGEETETIELTDTIYGTGTEMGGGPMGGDPH